MNVLLASFGLERHLQQEHPNEYFEDESTRRLTRASAGGAAPRRRRRRPAAATFSRDVRDEDEDHVVSDVDYDDEDDRLEKKARVEEVVVEDAGPAPLDEATWKAMSRMPELSPRVVLLREEAIERRHDNVIDADAVVKREKKEEGLQGLSMAEFLDVSMMEEEEEEKMSPPKYKEEARPQSPEFEQVLINERDSDMEDKCKKAYMDKSKMIEYVDLISDEEEEEEVLRCVAAVS